MRGYDPNASREGLMPGNLVNFDYFDGTKVPTICIAVWETSSRLTYPLLWLSLTERDITTFGDTFTSTNEPLATAETQA